MKIFSTKSGFTLAECLIALILLAIVLSGGMGFYFYSTEIMVKAMRKKIATEMAMQAMEQIKNAGYSSLPNPASGAWDAASTVTFSFSTQVFSAQQCRRVTDVEGTSPDINKRVEIQICWPATGACPCSTTHTVDIATNITSP